MRKFTLIALVFWFNAVTAQLPAEILTIQPGFVENRGQVLDQFSRVNSGVRFIYSNGYFNLQLKSNGFSYEMFELEDAQAMFEAGAYEHNADEKLLRIKDEKKLRSHRIDVTFIGARANAEISGTHPTGAKHNFYTTHTGENGITGVESYYQVIYRNIYPGIDLRFYAPEKMAQSLKYEWIIHPGVDPGIIKLKYYGTKMLEPTSNGGFSISTTRGIINESEIYAYQLEDNVQVDAGYHIKNNIVSYEVNRKKNKTVVIDPNISWFSYYGGNANEDIDESEMGIDANGNPLLIGRTNSTQYIASVGAFQVNYGGSLWDAYIAKFKSNGKLAWATYYGSTSIEGCHSVTADPFNNIFVGGETYSATGIATAGSHQPVFGGLMDAFLVKFTSNGIREWATYLGGSGLGDQIDGLICDGVGNLYFSGFTGSADNIATSGAYQEVFNGVDYYSGDVMLGEFTNNGQLVWCSYYSGPDQDRAHGIALGKNADLYIQGTCESTTQFATPGAHQTVYGGGAQDAFIAKWDTNGNFKWCSYYGGEGEERGRGIGTDANGNAYIVGWTNSTFNISTPGSFQEDWYEAYNKDNEGIPDGYIAKFKSSGNFGIEDSN